MNQIINIPKPLSLLTLFLTVFALTSCNVEKKLQEEELREIANYLKINNITVSPTSSGLYYIETREGTGPIPLPGDTAAVYYSVSFLDGVKLGEVTSGAPLKFKMGSNTVIKGFEEGVGMMKTGGKAKLIVPSSLAYGARGNGYLIPPYTALLYTIELKQVIQAR